MSRLNKTSIAPDCIVETLNNTKSYYERCCGFCILHKCFVTYKQYNRRQCIQKCCKHFIKKEV